MNIETLKRQALICIALLAGLSLGASAQAQVTIDRAWVRATVPNQTASGAFMRLTAQRDVQLTGARSAMAGIVELHEMKMDNGIMRMRPAGDLQLKAGQSIELRSGGHHLMMMDLKRQLKTGDIVPLTLEFRAPDGTVSKIEVRAIAGFATPGP